MVFLLGDIALSKTSYHVNTGLAKRVINMDSLQVNKIQPPSADSFKTRGPTMRLAKHKYKVGPGISANSMGGEWRFTIKKISSLAFIEVNMNG